MKLAFREVVLAFRRAPVLAMLSVITIAFSLFAFGLFGLVSLNIQTALNEVEDRVEIRAFISDGTKDAQVEELIRTVSGFPEVSDIGYVSPDSALVRARAELEEFRDVMEGAFLPGSIEIRLREGQRDPVSVEQLAERLRALPDIDDVRYGQEWVEKLYKIRGLAGLAGSVLAAVFALVAVIITGSTIRMAVLARAREIEIMKLVGATNWFVRLPYLIDGALKGLLGGLLAVCLTWGTSRLIAERLMQVTFFTGEQIVLGVLTGGILGFLGSWLSVARQLRQVWREP